MPGDQIHMIKINADLAKGWPQHHQAQGPAARRGRVERQDGQAARADPLKSGAAAPPLMQAPAPLSTAVVETDAVIVGAGPVGLFQVFELGLLEIKAHIIDSLPYPGGQCIELYPDKPIYDIPAVPVCTGKELTDNLLRQIAPFDATFHLGQEVTVVEKQEDGRFAVETNKGTRLLAKAIFIAGGVGSFQPRTLKIEGVEAHEGAQVHYRVKTPADFAGKHLLIMGGGDSALDWALNFCAGNADGNPHKAESVILVHRRDGFNAAPASVAKMKALCDAHQMQFIVGQATGIDERDGQLTGVKITGNDGITRVVPCDQVLAFFGLSPKLGPIADWGLALERKQIVVDTRSSRPACRASSRWVT